MTWGTKIQQLYNGLQYFEKNFEYYDFDEFVNRSHKDIRIIFNETVSVCRYGDVFYGASEDAYLKCEETLLSFLSELVTSFADSSILLRKYSKEWVKQKKVSCELYKIFKQRKIKNDCDTLIVVNDFATIRLIAQAILRYNAFIQFLFPMEKIILSVTDHMDIFVSTQDDVALQKVCDAVARFNDATGDALLQCENFTDL